jgi:cytochrome P450
MLNRIYSDRVLLAMLREEISPFVEITHPTNTGLPISELPRISNLDVEGLCTKCPLLKSCYVESLRLDSASWSFKEVKQDFVLQSREKGSQPWLLKKGEYAHAAHDLHNTDPNYFEDPMVWKADRHIRYEEGRKEGVADMGSIRPYGKL